MTNQKTAATDVGPLPKASPLPAKAPNARTMKRWILPVAVGIWLVSAVVAMAWHFGPGREVARQSEALETAELAEAAAARGDWPEAVKQYVAALAALPPDQAAERERLTLAYAVARIQIGELVEAQDQLEALVVELEKDPTPASRELLAAARHESATAAYYAAWLMRLEGATPEEWKVETERARQQFHLLAEQAAAAGDERAESYQKNLEAAIKLEQMDLTALLGKPPPKKCPGGCKNLSQRKRQQCQSRCQSDQEKQEGKDKKPDDARQEVKRDRGAGINSGGGKGS
jgi:hypothetical protein